MSIYHTFAKVFTIGRAIAIDLTDTTVVHKVRHVHMTLFFRPSGYSNDEMVAIQNHVTEKYGSSLPISFSLEPWNEINDKVHGDLKTLFYEVRSHFPDFLDRTETRKSHAHVKVRYRQRINQQRVLKKIAAKLEKEVTSVVTTNIVTENNSTEL